MLTPHLRALGTPALLASPADPTVAMDVGKPLALLAYLALSGVEATRDHLVDLLWAHVPPDRGRQSLRQALWQIRQRLGAESISQMGDRLRVAVPLGSDVADFLKAVTERRAADVVKLYPAPFFQTFAAPGALEFEQWADTMRSRLHTAFLRLGEEAVRQALDGGKSSSAVELATRLRNADPERQGGWRLLIETLNRSGQHPSALLEAEALEAHLRQEEVPIEEGTGRMLAEIRRTTAPAGARAEGPSPWELTELVGRETQFATLLSAWALANRGRPQFAHIVADPGLGKTRLLQELRRRLSAAGASVVMVGARPQEKETPYSLAADLAGALADLPGGRGVSRQSAASLVALDPRLASRYAESADTSDGPEGERRRLLALSDLIDAVAQERPTAILIDDLHWTDPVSARVLTGAIARSTGPALVVTTSRPGRPGMLRDERATVIGLDPLTPAAVAALVAGFGSFEPELEGEEFAVRLHAMCGGNPLRALEALREATSLGLLRLAEGHWNVLDGEALGRAWERMRDPAERLRRLPEEDRRVLLALALWGRSATIGTIESLIEEPRSAVEEGGRRLERAGLAIETNGEWSPLHHTVSELVQAVASEEERQILHRRIAAHLIPSATDPRTRREVASHLWSAGDRAGTAKALGEWVVGTRGAGDRRDAAVILDELAPPEVAVGERRSVLAALPWRVRHPLPGWSIPASVISALFIMGWGGYVWLSQPVALVATVLPILPSPALPAPVFELRDRLDRRVRGRSGQLTARGAEGSWVGGDTIVPLVDGRGEFNNLKIGAPPGQIRTVELLLEGAVLGRMTVAYPETAFRLRWRSASANGIPFDPAADTVAVRAGRPVELHTVFGYTALCSCSVELDVTPTWRRDRSRGWQALKALYAPRAEGEAEQSFTITAPDRPGTYHLIFVIGPEPTASFLLSQTNWTVGIPHWNDGNDIADLTPPEIAQARAQGTLVRTWLKSSEEHETRGPARGTTTRLSTSAVGITVLTIRVTE